MWFLLSLNLSHWIGSFSTVGLDSHLGFRQKGLREAKLFTFHIFERRRREESWEEERRARIPKQNWKRFSVGTKIEEINCWHEFRGEGTAHLLQAHILRQWSTANIYCAQKSRRVRPHLLQACFSRSCTMHLLQTIQYSFCTIFEDSLGTKFEAVQQH